MSEAIIVALITGGLSVLGVVISNVSSNLRMQFEIKKQQAVTDEKIDELTREVRDHNGFAKRMPVVEEKLKVVDHRLEDLEKGK